ncbi:MAG: hypothetical protein R3B07_17390 [Polyangiaceae bacterium]
MLNVVSPVASQDAAGRYAEQIARVGYAVVPGLYEPRVSRIRAVAVEQYERLGCPPVVNPGHLTDGESSSGATAAGYAIAEILSRHPELGPLILHEHAVEIARRTLGADAVLELLGVLISDPTRPFFSWHQHLGGIDEQRWQREPYVHHGVPQRLLMLVYLQELSAEYGSLLVLPRPVGSQEPPPGDIQAMHWPGALEVHGPVGTVVFIEESTWHAALPQRCSGLRLFAGCYFAAASALGGQASDIGLSRLDLDALMTGAET